jgi:tetratricopeptide (TPR) repeat protein
MNILLDEDRLEQMGRPFRISLVLVIHLLIWPGYVFGGEEPASDSKAASNVGSIGLNIGSESTDLQNFRNQLEEAARKRREKGFGAAETVLASLLKSSPPAEIQRAALLEMAVVAEEVSNLSKAQAFYGEFLKRFPDDPDASEVLLRQALICRKMGANVLALSKFYAVLSTSLRLKPDRLEYYQRLVIQAQTEIAETYYLQGKYKEAVEFLARLLKLEATEEQKVQITYKMIQSLSALGRFAEVVPKAELFIERYTQANQMAEIRFLLADALKKLGRDREAVQQVMILLEGQQREAERDAATWAYWRRRAGNEIANQLYASGDYINALAIYKSLAGLDRTPEWRVPVWYQIGLVYERLQQPQKAREHYENILAAGKETATNSTNSNLSVVRDMAAWRKDYLTWLMRAEQSNEKLGELQSGRNSELIQ